MREEPDGRAGRSSVRARFSDRTLRAGKTSRPLQKPCGTDAAERGKPQIVRKCRERGVNSPLFLRNSRHFRVKSKERNPSKKSPSELIPSLSAANGREKCDLEEVYRGGAALPCPQSGNPLHPSAASPPSSFGRREERRFRCSRPRILRRGASPSRAARRFARERVRARHPPTRSGARGRGSSAPFRPRAAPRPESRCGR